MTSYDYFRLFTSMIFIIVNNRRSDCLSAKAAEKSISIRASPFWVDKGAQWCLISPHYDANQESFLNRILRLICEHDKISAWFPILNILARRGMSSKLWAKSYISIEIKEASKWQPKAFHRDRHERNRHIYNLSMQKMRSWAHMRNASASKKMYMKFYLSQWSSPGQKAEWSLQIYRPLRNISFMANITIALPVNFWLSPSYFYRTKIWLYAALESTDDEAMLISRRELLSSKKMPHDFIATIQLLKFHLKRHRRRWFDWSLCRRMIIWSISGITDSKFA